MDFYAAPVRKPVRFYGVGLLVMLVAALMLSSCAMPMLTAEDTNSNTDAAQATDVPMEEPAEATGELYNGIPTGYTEEGYVYRGNPDAPITMYEYSDYQCPFCRRYFSQTEASIDEMYVKSGQVKVVFKDFPLVQIHPNARAASAVALCSAQQSPSAFWQMHNLLFETQDQWASLPDPTAFFDGLALQVEVDKNEFDACINTGDVEELIDTAFADARALNFQGTPSFHFVNEETGDAYDLVGAQPFDRFQAWLDAMIAGEAPADATAGADNGGGDNEIPYWATAEGLAPDPERPGYTMAGDQFRGDLDAPVVIIEYSDFQCPFCGRHVSETQPTLDEQFVETGQVRWVFKHFPLNIHPQAPAAGAAAECAADQDMFWEMHELLFEDVQEWSISDPTPVFIELADQLSLDVAAFESCINGEDAMARVESDFAEGRPYVQGTPTFIVMVGEQGRIIPGALPVDSFVEALNSVLEAVQ